MKKIIIAILTSALFISCNNKELETRIAQLTTEKSQMEKEATERDSALYSFIQSVNEIENNLSIIKQKEQILAETKNVEFKENYKDRIISDIDLIHKLMQENKAKVSDLNQKLKENEGKLKKVRLKIPELEKMVENLTIKVAERDKEIASLHDELSTVNAALRNLFNEYNDRLNELADKEEKLNTAYYVIGTSKELKEKGIISKEGGLLGVGKTDVLSQDFNKSDFIQCDISLTPSIAVTAKKARVITTHPSGSYKLEGEGKVEKLSISDPEAFWGASKFLVVVVEN